MMEFNDGPKSRLVVDAYHRDCRRPCPRVPDFGVLVCAGRINANLVAAHTGLCSAARNAVAGAAELGEQAPAVAAQGSPSMSHTRTKGVTIAVDGLR
jgi:hypothetical protein